MNRYMEGKSLILYHKEDNDGVVSGAMIYNYLVYDLQCEKEDVICVGLDYNISKSIKRKDIKEWSKIYDHLYITDFSLPIPLMEYAYKLFDKRFVWLDHHKPIIEASYRSKICNCEGAREWNRSAILNVFRFLYDPFDVDWHDNHENIPKLLRILSAWDSFTYKQEHFSLDYVQKVNYGFTHLFKLDLFEVSRMLEFSDEPEMRRLIERCYQVGKILVADEMFRMENILKTSGDFEWTVGPDNRKCVVIFNQGPSNSQMFESVKDIVNNAAVFKHNSNGTWTVSLYNTLNEDTSFHCGSYCRENYKGGGHQGASGLQIKNSKLMKMLKTKHI